MLKTMTYAIAHAAATDAADRQMRDAGRDHWNWQDYQLAVDTEKRLWWSRFITHKTPDCTCLGNVWNECVLFDTEVPANEIG